MLMMIALLKIQYKILMNFNNLIHNGPLNKKNWVINQNNSKNLIKIDKSKIIQIVYFCQKLTHKADKITVQK